MLAATCELICDQGGHWDPTITLTDDNGDPVNLTGYTARMVVKATETSPTALVEITSAGGGITITPATGVLQPVLTSAQTALLPAGRLVYGLEVTVSGKTYHVLTGSFYVRPEVAVTP